MLSNHFRDSDALIQETTNAILDTIVEFLEGKKINNGGKVFDFIVDSKINPKHEKETGWNSALDTAINYILEAKK